MTGWEWLLIGPLVTAAIVQAGKYLAIAVKIDVQAEAAQIAAWVVATGLALLAKAHLPIDLGPVLAAAQPILAGALASALSYVVHDIAAALQALYAWLQSLVPPPPAS